MVSGNTGLASAEVDFTALAPEDQKAVAERLLAIQNSKWKPFWCRNPKCNGDPHAARGPLGEMIYVSETAKSGPNGEPVADFYGNPETGVGRVVLDPTRAEPGDVYLARVVLDPKWAHNHAREDQRLPKWNEPWNLFIMSGRGTGKTRTGVEFVTLHARKGLDGAILGRRGTEVVNTHVKEILENAHPEFMPIHWASKDILEWPEVTMPDGTKRNPITYLFSAEKPENIRSINISYYWIDEAAFMEFIKTAHMNLKLACRIETAENPKHVLITSTPQPTEWTMEMEDDPDVIVRRVATYANRANLGVSYLKDLVKDLEGTRMGRQELHGEVLRDVQGALWNDSMFKHIKNLDAAAFVSLCESMDDVVVAVDPAGTANKRSDETGIIAVGAQHTDEHGDRLEVSRFYVLADGTIKGTPTEWARRVYSVAKVVRARRIIAEKNFGADMVKQVLRDFANLNPDEATNDDGDNMFDFVKEADARESKETRAESTVGKYEQGRVEHVPNPTVYGDLSRLEKEQVTWIPRSRGGKAPSPNRIDALVWAVKALEKAVRYSSSMATNRTIIQRTTGHTRTATASGSAAAPLPAIPEAKQPVTFVEVQEARKRQWAVETGRKWPTKPKRPAGVTKV